MSIRQIAKAEGCGADTVSRLTRGIGMEGVMSRVKAESEALPPLLWGELGDEAKRALEDFRYFRNRYFQRETPAFQQEVCDIITGLTPEQPLVALWPPGFGKTTCITHDYPIWRMLRARVHQQRFACLLLSKSDPMARRFIRRLKKTFEQNQLLSEDFGWFKPESADRWSDYEVMVDGFQIEAQGKESTFTSAGARSHIYGLRVDLIIADDLVDSENSRTSDSTQKLSEWFHEEVESRMEKGASLAVCGTRFTMLDLYGHLIGLKDEVSGDPLYRIVTFKAHDVDKCPGPDGPHEAYPSGCMLWPEQKTFKQLNIARQKLTTARFDFVYNQVESSDDENLFRMEWIEAAKDKDRVMWDIPPGCSLRATIDPSPTMYACAQVWAFDPETEKRYLIAIERKKMTVPEMLGLMEDWTLRLHRRGYFPMWIFEENAAQRWLFQSLDYKLLRQRTNINVRAHTTHRNKVDPMYGVQSLAPLYEFQKISLPWGDPASRKSLEFFLTELKSYPNGSTDDGVMAQWFFEWNIRSITHNQTQTYMDPPYMPPYLKKGRKLVAVS